MSHYLTQAEFDAIPADYREVYEDGRHVRLRMGAGGAELEEVEIVSLIDSVPVRLLGLNSEARIVQDGQASYKVQYRQTRGAGEWRNYMPNKRYDYTAAQVLMDKLIVRAQTPIGGHSPLS